MPIRNSGVCHCRLPFRLQFSRFPYVVIVEIDGAWGELLIFNPYGSFLALEIVWWWAVLDVNERRLSVNEKLMTLIVARNLGHFEIKFELF
jgi:hypothetical protein